MLLNREPYRKVFKLFTFFGLWNEVPLRQRILTFNLLYSLMIFQVFLMILSVFQANDLEEILSAVKFLPLWPIIIYSIYSFTVKKNQLKKFIAIVDQIELENKSATVHIDNACQVVKKLYQFAGILTASMLGFYYICQLNLDYLIFPLYFPSFIENKKLVYGCWEGIEAIVSFYGCIVYTPLNEFRSSLLIVMDHIMRCFQEKLRMLKTTDNEQELIKCIKFHLQIKE
ncbi:hypothetical protein PVAND_013505 [Polypedilum vanderplanki]|uniref:Odorant receptor n=1 Tax=Polypedilum vanderplanki TaxID=319348 RepID=A0A9J6CQI8_POLVA|nr:hypothetical protein PVAND_013505 [Polypedilum vanderplanki]